MSINWDDVRREYETTDITLSDLAIKYNIKYPTIKSRNQRQGWTKDASKLASIDKDASKVKDASKARPGNKNAVGHGAPKGNRNAVGSPGGNGGPYGNKKAVATGEHEAIWMSMLTETEQSLFYAVETDELKQIEHDIRMENVRELRMLNRIQEVMGGFELDDITSKSEFFKEKIGENVEFVDGLPKMVPVYKTTQIETERHAKQRAKLERVLRIEEALTRVRERKSKLLELKHKLLSNPLAGEEQRLRVEKLQAEVKVLGGYSGAVVQIIDDVPKAVT